MEQKSTYTTQTKPIAIPAPSKNNTTSREVQTFSFEVGSPAFSDCESALDEDENAYDMYHIPSHHRRNALSFEDGFEFPLVSTRQKRSCTCAPGAHAAASIVKQQTLAAKDVLEGAGRSD
ncbi:hypothetical protein Daesc_005776 [Daldinia eschscholtzii]|uniref:Uncharacterized protein n=1 Tax=Daldinia eschscholtzii TaxID=292717 RepID=A0AAX6MMR7_9PEZI